MLDLGVFGRIWAWFGGFLAARHNMEEESHVTAFAVVFLILPELH